MSNAKYLFVKNSSFSFAEKLLPVLFSFTYTILLTAALSSAEYGLFNYIIAFALGFANLFGSTTLNNLLTNFTAQKSSKSLFKKVFIAEFLIAGAIFLGLMLFNNIIITSVGGTTLSIIIMAGAILFLNPLTTIFASLNKGMENFNRVFVASMLENLINLIFIALFVVILGYGIEGAFYSKYLSLIGSALIYIFYLKKTSFKNKPINKKEVITYGKFSVIVEVIKEGGSMIQVIIMGLFIGPAILGVYYVARKVTSLALNAPSEAIGDVLFPLNSKNFNNKKNIENYSSICIKGAIILLVIMSIALIICAPLIIGIFFPKYTAALELIPLLALLFIFEGYRKIDTIFKSINKVQFNLLQAIITFTIEIIVLLIFVPWLGVKGLIIAQIIWSAINGFTGYLLLRKVGGIKLSLIPMPRDLKYFYKEIRHLIPILFKEVKNKF